jgi:hypothetical protein
MKNHNKDAMTLQSQLTIESQAIGSEYIPRHNSDDNFLDYYKQFVIDSKREGNRHLEGSYNHFQAFLKKSYIAPVGITENPCFRFRQYLPDHFIRDTPMNYFAWFKKVLKAATKEGYFRINPAENIKGNTSKSLKENLEIEEYLALLHIPYRCIFRRMLEYTHIKLF